MKGYLNKPFPFIESTSNKILVSFLFSTFIYVFLITFQPFGIANIQFYKPLFILGFSLITLVVLLFSFLLMPLIYKQFFDTDNWTIKKNAIFISFQFLAITILNWVFNSTVGQDITTQHSLLFFIFITISVGIIPTIFLTYFIERNLEKRNQNLAKTFNNKLPGLRRNHKSPSIKIISENNSEEVNIKLDQLLCVRSEGNYVNIFFMDKDIIKRKLIRNKISNIIEQLEMHKSIKRCHRSFIVNFSKVNQVNGNARSFNLQIDKLDFTIPVSRSFPKNILNKIDTL